MCSRAPRSVVKIQAALCVLCFMGDSPVCNVHRLFSRLDII